MHQLFNKFFCFGELCYILNMLTYPLRFWLCILASFPTVFTFQFCIFFFKFLYILYLLCKAFIFIFLYTNPTAFVFRAVFTRKLNADFFFKFCLCHFSLSFGGTISFQAIMLPSYTSFS